MISGGVITPPNLKKNRVSFHWDAKSEAILSLGWSTYMANACCKPMMIATSHDNFSSLAKKGGAGWPFGLKGLYGMHRNLKS